ncbi:MAG: HDOD domain-containing protein [Gaiellales bacterium]
METLDPSLVGRVHVARQPLFDVRRKARGYELLYRDDPAAITAARSDSDATSSTIVTAFELGLSTIVGASPAWINVTEDLLCSDLLEVLPPDRVVLEVLETVRPTPAVLDALDRYRSLGYRLALDDVTGAAPSQIADRVHAVKLDYRLTDKSRLAETVAALRRRGLRVVIEKVETYEELADCVAAGCDLYQGYVFGRPEISSGRRLSTAAASRVQLVSALRDPNVELSDLEKLVVQDVTLSYRLLTYINSAHVALGRRVESIRQAIVLLGLHKVRNWATLLLLTDLDAGRPDLVESSAIRARMAEVIGPKLRLKDDTAFTVGLLSRLDVLVGMPFADVLDGLPLATEVKDGLLGSGPYADLLAEIVAYESGEFSQVTVPDRVLATAFHEALAHSHSGALHPS